LKIHTLCCGSICITQSAANGGKRVADAAQALALPEAMLRRVPVCVWLVEHPMGLVLVDTGWSRSLIPNGEFSPAAAKGLISPALRRYFRPELPAGEAACERLAAMGIAPRDLACVLATQLTADHVCGMRDLAGAQRLLVNENERFWSCRSIFALRQPRGLWEQLPLETFYMRGTATGPRGVSYDLFGDGTFVLIETPGYTLGQTAVLLRGDDKYALISSDIALTADELRAGKMAGHIFTPEMGRPSMEWLQRTALSPDCAAVLVGHDAAALKQGVVEI